MINYTRFLSQCVALVGSLFFVIACESQQESPAQVVADSGAMNSDLQGVNSPFPTDSLSLQTFEKLMAYARENELSELSLSAIIGHVGEWFMEKPYVAGTLDQNTRETLVIKLDGFDCVTFVESTLALSRGIKEASYSFDGFAEKLLEQRYRDEVLDGYCSRLHYFSEWIANNEQKGIVEDITQRLGGERLPKRLNFMSTHRESYPQLATDDSIFQELVDVEKDLKDMEIFYIPQDEISEAYASLETGDIIALATDIEGLDVVHTGFAYKFEGGNVGLLHASTTRGVTVSPDLQEYVENNRRQIGILVARPRA